MLGSNPFRSNSNDFHFDTEIINSTAAGTFSVLKRLPIPTYYGDEICHVNGLKYAFDASRQACWRVLRISDFLMNEKFDIPNITNR